MAEPHEASNQQATALTFTCFAEHDTTSQEPTAQTVIPVDLYRLSDNALLFVRTDQTEQDEHQCAEGEVPQEAHSEVLTDEPSPGEPAPEPYRTHPRFRSLLACCALTLVLGASMGGYLFLLPLFARATITITPQIQTLHTDTTLIVTTTPRAGQVQGRPLAAISLTKSATVPATGHAHQAATEATGVITVYNADTTQSYTIPAGTILITHSGLMVVTDATVTVQAAIPPSFGIGITPAHVVRSGAAGNIAAYAINTRCCGSQFLTAINTTAFRGGMDEKDYAFVQTSDIQNAATDLTTALTPQVTTALTNEARPGEQLVPPVCSSHTNTNAQPGQEAVTITVSVTQTCRSVAYLTDSLTQAATGMLSHQAPLAHFQQTGSVQVTIIGSTYEQNTVALHVAVSGSWVYSISEETLTRFKTIVAGTSLQEAEAVLTSQAGIAHVRISLQRYDFQPNLPTNPQQINAQLFYLIS